MRRPEGSAQIRANSLRPRVRASVVRALSQLAGSDAPYISASAMMPGTIAQRNRARQPNAGMTYAADSAAAMKPMDQPACRMPVAVARILVGTTSATSSVPMLYTDPMPKPERNRAAATCQYEEHRPMALVHTENSSIDHQVTRTRPARSEIQPAMMPPMPMPKSV